MMNIKRLPSGRLAIEFGEGSLHRMMAGRESIPLTLIDPARGTAQTVLLRYRAQPITVKHERRSQDTLNLVERDAIEKANALIRARRLFYRQIHELERVAAVSGEINVDHFSGFLDMNYDQSELHSHDDLIRFLIHLSPTFERNNAQWPPPADDNGFDAC